MNTVIRIVNLNQKVSNFLRIKQKQDLNTFFSSSSQFMLNFLLHK